jgi:hypothetical protein
VVALAPPHYPHLLVRFFFVAVAAVLVGARVLLLREVLRLLLNLAVVGAAGSGVILGGDGAAGTWGHGNGLRVGVGVGIPMDAVRPLNGEEIGGDREQIKFYQN